MKEQAEAKRIQEEKKKKKKERLEEQKLKNLPLTKEQILEKNAERKKIIDE